MATLFFDGFDRGTVLGRLDPQYWSTQYRNDPGYAFGGYSYNHSIDNYTPEYKTSIVNNGARPIWSYAPGGSCYFCGGDPIPPEWGMEIGYPGNEYPAFGSAPGFLALSNLPINDPNFLAPITYIQLSGFPQPSGNQTYFGARFLGLETKHTDYDSRLDSLRFDKPGRFDYRHPLLAFCSGNTTGLLLSIIKTTGNNLSLLEGEKMTMGLQVEQNNEILGVFDMNLNGTVSDSLLSSVYTPGHSYPYSLNALKGKVLTLSAGVRPGSRPLLFSRWNHLEFLLSTGDDPYLSVKIEGIELSIIDSDSTNTNKDTWLTELPISGFSYNNIRLFNRTYFSGIAPDAPNDLAKDIIGRSYYGRGSLTLIDDVTLIDNVGEPSFWLGPTAKVLPLSPGFNSDLNNNGSVVDGLREWTTNAGSHRKALKNYDGDIGAIETINSGAVTAVRFDNHGLGTDSSSAWRTSFNDGIAGLKVYNSVRKNFLDTSFTNVFYTGVSDPMALYTKLLIKTDRNIYNVITNNEISQISPVALSLNPKRFNDASILFASNDSYLYTPYGDLHTTDLDRPSENNLFTIESWVYFTNGNEQITLYGKKPPTSYPQISNLRVDIQSTNFEFVCTTGYIQYNTYIDDELLAYRRLYFPSAISTGVWSHVALVNDAIQDFRGTLVNNIRYYNHDYRLIAYLNGLSGTSHEIWNSLDANLSVYTTDNNRFAWSPAVLSYSSNNFNFTNSVSGLSIVSGIGSVMGLGNNISPLSGVYAEYFPTIRLPTNSSWQERTNIPTTIVTSGWASINQNNLNGTYTLTGFRNGRPTWTNQGGSVIEWTGSYWSMFSPGWFKNWTDSFLPPQAEQFNTNGWTDGVTNGVGTLSYTTTPSVSALNISETRCNNKIAYLVTQAGLSSLTGLYCYGGIHNNAYYYVNIENPNYYLYNAYWTPWNQSSESQRRWVIGSGLLGTAQLSTSSNIYYVHNIAPSTGETIVATRVLYNSHMKLSIQTQNNSNSIFTVYKNNIAQRDLTRDSDGIISGIIPVVSGDIIDLRTIYRSYPSLQSGNPTAIASLSLSSPVQSGLYKLPTIFVNNSKRPDGVVGKFIDDYTSTSSSNNNFPLFIGGGGLIDNYRFTHGAFYTQGVQSRSRYWTNFDQPTQPFPSVYNDYATVGPVHNVTRTRYSTIQYFAMQNPQTQQPWTSGLVATSGFLFGVKKL